MEGDFRKSVEQDPLFAAEGMDIENARAALDELERSLPAVEREYAETAVRKLFFVRYPLARYAFPLSFSRLFLQCEEARREYLASPSLARARALANLWQRTAAELSRSLKRYKTLQNLLVLAERGRDFAMQDSNGFITSYAYANALLELLEKNARVLQEEAADRAVLIAAKTSAQVTAREVAAIPQYKGVSVTPFDEKLQRATVESGTWPYRYGDIVEEYGPFSFVLPHLDGAPADHAFKLYVLKEKRTGLLSMWVALVDRFLFLDIWNLMPSNDGLVRGAYATWVGLEKKEMPYWHEPATTLYSSRDATYWMDIATIIDASRRPELDQRFLSMQRSSMYDKILVECARDARSMVAHLRRRKRAEVAKQYSLAYDFLTRTHPSIFFLAFNASVWRLSERPNFLGERHQEVDPKKRLSEEQQKTMLTDDVLETVMVASKLREERGQMQGWLD